MRIYFRHECFLIKSISCHRLCPHPPPPQKVFVLVTPLHTSIFTTIFLILGLACAIDIVKIYHYCVPTSVGSKTRRSEIKIKTNIRQSKIKIEIKIHSSRSRSRSDMSEIKIKTTRPRLITNKKGK